MVQLMVKKEENGEENDPIHVQEAEGQQNLILCGRHEP
jgi:hypothetical protein